MPQPTLVHEKLGPTPVDILSRDIYLVFDTFPQFEQMDAVEQLQILIISVKHDGSVGHLRFLGMFQEDDNENASLAKDRLLGKCYWQLVMFLRVSSYSHAFKISTLNFSDVVFDTDTYQRSCSISHLHTNTF